MSQEILITKCEVRCQFSSSGVNCVYYVLKSCIFVEVDDLWSIGRYAYFLNQRKYL